MCDSKLSGLHPFDNMAMIHEVKNWSKTEGRMWVHETPILEVIFATLTENLSITNDTHRPQKYSTSPELVVGTHFHARHGTKAILVFLPADGEASWLLLPSLVSLLSGSTV